MPSIPGLAALCGASYENQHSWDADNIMSKHEAAAALGSRLVEIVSVWHGRPGVAPTITGALSEFDVALLFRRPTSTAFGGPARQSRPREQQHGRRNLLPAGSTGRVESVCSRPDVGTSKRSVWWIYKTGQFSLRDCSTLICLPDGRRARNLARFVSVSRPTDLSSITLRKFFGKVQAIGLQ